MLNFRLVILINCNKISLHDLLSKDYIKFYNQRCEAYWNYYKTYQKITNDKTEAIFKSKISKFFTKDDFVVFLLIEQLLVAPVSTSETGKQNNTSGIINQENLYNNLLLFF